MATVITNLLSAIPWIGKDFVEFDLLLNNLCLLPTIGKIDLHALKKGRKIRLEKEEYLMIPYSFVAKLVGFIDGDGYFLIHKIINNFIKINLTISLDINELSTLNYILSILNLGKISIFPKEGKKKLVS